MTAAGDDAPGAGDDAPPSLKPPKGFAAGAGAAAVLSFAGSAAFGGATPKLNPPVAGAGAGAGAVAGLPNEKPPVAGAAACAGVVDDPEAEAALSAGLAAPPKLNPPAIGIGCSCPGSTSVSAISLPISSMD